MKPTPRKALLTAHVVFSVGWIGAVGAFLAMNIVGLTSNDRELARAMFRSMNVVGLYAIVPASVLSIVSGILQGLWTQWGLLRHRWVLTKFIIGVLSTTALLLHQFTAVREAAHRAEQGVPVGQVGVQLIADASVAIVLLLFATILSVFKPWGLTRYGQRKRDESAPPRGLAPSAKVTIAIVVVVLGAFIAIHLARGGMHH